MQRRDVMFRSEGGRVAAWVYPSSIRPAAPADAGPCVVMAHGFSLTRHDGLVPFAERLAGAGATVVVFDHRFLGDSPGEPRQRVRRSDQMADWRNAVAFARTIPEVDPARVALWGFSLSGGHAVEAAGDDGRIAAVMALCPVLNGFDRVRSTPPGVVAWLLARCIADAAGHHSLIPVTGPPGSRAAMSLAGEADGFAASVADGSPWRNEVSPGPLITMAFHRTWAKATRLPMPIWVGQGDADVSMSSRAIAKLVAGAAGAELHRYPVDHFGPFQPAMTARIANDQAEFFTRRVLNPAYP